MRASRLAWSGLWASGGQMAQAVLGIAGTVVLVRLVGVEGYGVFALGLVFTGLADVFVGGHTADALVQRRTITRAHRAAAFTLSLLLGLVAACAVFASAPLATRWFGVAELGDVLRAMAALSLLTALAAAPNQLLVRRTAFKALSAVSAVAAMAALAVGIALALSGAGVWSLVAMETTRRTVSLMLLLRASGLRPRLSVASGPMGDVRRFAFRRVENQGLGYLSQHIVPRVVIAQALGTEALGFYAVARRLLDQLHGVLSAPAAAVAFPAASRWQEDRQKIATLLLSGIRLTTWVHWPATLGIIVVAPTLLPLALGPQWIAAAAMLQCLAIGSLRVPLAAFNGAVLVAMARTRWVSVISLASIALALPLFALLLPYGLTGIAAALALRQWLVWPLSASLLQRATGLSPWRQLGELARAGAPAVLMAVGVAVSTPLFGDLGAAQTLAVQVALGLALYPLAFAIVLPAEARAAIGAAARLLAGERRAAMADFLAAVRPPANGKP